MWLRLVKGSNTCLNIPYDLYVELFMEFLNDCKRLRNFGFMYNRVCDDRLMHMKLLQHLRFQTVLPAGEMLLEKVTKAVEREV